MEIKAECGHCGQHFLLDDASIGQQFVCPNCQETITARVAAPGASFAAKEVKTNVKQGAAIGGWVCFGLAVIVLFIPLPTWYIYGPLFLVSFILSIIAMAQGRIASGLILLLSNVIGVPILFVVAIFFGIATWG
jgi:DNA-directed RNA polymerase subunit RPC12/RpoP